MVGCTEVRNGLHDIRSVDLFLLVLHTHRGGLRHTTLHSTECTQTTTRDAVMSNETLAIIIAIIIMVPAILFYHFVIVRNYLDDILPPTVKSLFSNGHPRKIKK
tara:strand:- start:82 stop:393 length:312 start_codon:yes stop_codon:yes gene_type:complete